MTITLAQALLVGLVYFAANTSFLAGLGYFTTWRPLVNGLLVGVILGDPVRGAQVGALINVLYLGYMSVGGTLGIGDAALAGILGATVTISAAVPDATQAIGLGVLAGVLLGNLGFPLLSLRMALDNRIVRRIDQEAEQGDTRAIVWWHIAPAQALLLAITLPAAAILALVVPPLVNAGVSLAPSFILRGIGLAGTSLAAALGISLAMKFVFKGRGILAFLGGFALYALTQADIGLYVFAVLVLLAASDLAKTGALVGLLRKRSGALSFILWQFFSHSSYSYERLQGSGLAAALAPAIQRLYRSPQERASALRRHLAFFNVEPNWGSAVVGVALKLEEEHAAGLTAAETIVATKQALMGAISGFGDTVSQGAILPLILSIGLSMSLAPAGGTWSIAGVLAYLAIICPLMLAISIASFSAGYEMGRSAIVAILSNQTLKRWVAIAELAGAFMLGVLSAMRSVIGLPVTAGSALPNLLFNAGAQLGLVLLCYMLVKKLEVKPTLILIAAVVVGILAAAGGMI
ncbi:MAG: PTS system mannose/fructose/sorbose family transporter subunit IID [Chloroflexi bacterium]|nr:PTS system mannose/fructose/sorbose family transporter subunit IID [Chloroflexota bacterium]MCL5275925.1 PTS system mannose/fructose/sorbose family transporter subunit IID [Chloroflexota bacterium]